ncbi:hypothetical protein CPter291_4029 [Collimonas pratensis]|uniref:Uncharacterized protein n=1 Tax=Collimonas pratensis TaxID=279113 RepID=A0ABM5ZAX0_9BURK|nr:hypothetical protein CPter291_4029 [Collimonas pratensis]
MYFTSLPAVCGARPFSLRSAQDERRKHGAGGNVSVYI